MTSVRRLKNRRPWPNANLQLAIYTATGRLKHKRKAIVGADALARLSGAARRRRNASSSTRSTTSIIIWKQFERNVVRHTAARWSSARCRRGRSDFVLRLAKETRRTADRQVEVDDHRGDRSQRAARASRPRSRSRRISANTSCNWRTNGRTTSWLPRCTRRATRSPIFSPRSLGVEREDGHRKADDDRARACCARSFSPPISASPARISWWPIPARSCIVENEGNARLTTSAPQDPHRDRGHREADSACAGSRVLSEAAGPQRDRASRSRSTRRFSRGPRRRAKSTGRKSSTSCCSTTAAPSCWPNRGEAAVAVLHSLRRVPEHCPVYRKIGGHNYPVGLFGTDRRDYHAAISWASHDPWLPFASSLCGACAEVCPVKIDIPKMLLELRHDVTDAKPQDGRRAHGKVDFPALLVRDDPARPLLFSRWDGSEVFSWEARWGLDQPRAGGDGDSARGWLAQPARSAAASGEELP